MFWARRVLVFSAIAVVLLAVWLWRPASSGRRPAGPPLVVHCAAGLKAPVEAAARLYERRTGAAIQLQYGGSGTLLAALQVSGQGDLFVAADQSYLDLARTNGLLAEVIPLAWQTPVIGVHRGNPKGIRGVPDLRRADVALALANPGAAAIGKVARDLLQNTGDWAPLEARAKVFKPTVNDLANDLKLGVVDAAVVWDATVAQYPELEAVAVPAFAAGTQQVAVGVLARCRQPAAALRFARFLGAPEEGLKLLAQAGLRPVHGDAWAERPEVVLFSGGVNRLAIDDTVRAFEEREGVRVTRVYNGCGILVAQMKSGQQPDAYLACDVSFLDPVAGLFQERALVSETDIVILVAQGNPRKVLRLPDLAQPGLRVGVANAQQSTLGDLTARLLREAGILDAVMANVKTQTPTADLLVNQMRTGALDAVVVYRANTSQVRSALDVVPLDLPGAKAVQPYAVGRNSRHALLMRRLLEAIQSAESRRRYEALGFRWKGGG